MSVVVPKGMSVDLALKLLWRESIRENIPNEIQRAQYREKESAKRHNIRKEWAKRKRRGRSARRKVRRKGILRVFEK